MSQIATERLRELLDERGVEYDTDDLWNHAQKHDSTSWKCDNGKLANFSEIDYPHMTKLRIYDCTPEQAIAATLGSGKLTAEQVREAVKRCAAFDYGEFGEYVSCENWQAIADELNAALGGGECELVYGENDHGDDGWWCQSCGGWFAASFRHTGRNNIIEPRFCQHCGKAVKR